MLSHTYYFFCQLLSSSLLAVFQLPAFAAFAVSALAFARMPGCHAASLLFRQLLAWLPPAAAFASFRSYEGTEGLLA
jgi:hypothetical protein